MYFLKFILTAAGESFKRAAEIHMELETKHETASNLCEAAQVFKREDPHGMHMCFFPYDYVHNVIAIFLLLSSHRGCHLLPKSSRNLHRHGILYLSACLVFQ